MNAGEIAARVWDVCAWFFLLSIVAAPFVVIVQRCRARGRRLFRDIPRERLQGLHADSRIDHRWDA